MTEAVSSKSLQKANLEEKIACYISMALLVLLPVEEIIFEFLRKFKVGSFKNFTPSKYQAEIIAGFGIALTVLVVARIIYKAVKKQLKFYVADVFYATLIIFMLLSMIFSVNFGVFAGGSHYNCEWPTHFLCYFGLFYAGSLIKDSTLRKRLLYAYIVVALIEAVVAFFQTFDWEITYCLFRTDRIAKTTYGTVQNTNFYGTLACILTAAASGLFIFSSKITKSKVFKWGMFALSNFVFYTLLASQARLAWLGMAGFIFFYAVSLVVMRKGSIDKASLKQITIDFLTLIIGYVAVIIITIICTPYIVSRVEYTSEHDTFATITDEGFGSGRGWIWKVAFHATRNYPLTGIGLDNLGQAFREMPTYIKGVSLVQDKGHNEYIHMMATQGIPAIINYLLLLIYSVSRAVKNIFGEKDDVKRSLLWICLGIVAAYLAQALLSSSVLNVAPYFWLMLGIITPRINPISFKKKG